MWSVQGCHLVYDTPVVLLPTGVEGRSEHIIDLLYFILSNVCGEKAKKRKLESVVGNSD